MAINSPITVNNTFEDWRTRLNDILAYQTPTDLGSGSSYDIDVLAGCNKICSPNAAGTCTFTMSNLVAGISGCVSIIFPSSGNKPTVYAFPSYIKWENGVTPTPSYTYSVRDIFCYYVEKVGDSNGTTVVIGKILYNVF